VEKFAGDAAMVVFGVPAVHDDDAERAVRAALEIRDGASELEVRVGRQHGEAMTRRARTASSWSARSSQCRRPAAAEC